MSTFLNLSKNSATAVNQRKNVASFSNLSKTAGLNSFLLMEDGFCILLETLDKIILEQSNPVGISYSNLAKS